MSMLRQNVILHLHNLRIQIARAFFADTSSPIYSVDSPSHHDASDIPVTDNTDFQGSVGILRNNLGKNPRIGDYCRGNVYNMTFGYLDFSPILNRRGKSFTP
jgi:hypothetical protein